MKFIAKEEQDKILAGDIVLLNEVLSRVCNKAIETTIGKIPEVLSRVMKNTAALQKMNTEFFSDNEGFKDNEDIVTSVITDIESKSPNMDYSDILKEARDEIHKKIRATNAVGKVETGLPDKINLSGNGVI